MDHRALLARVEDQKTTKKKTVVSWASWLPQSGRICEWATINGSLCAMDWLTSNPLDLKSTTPSQVAGGLAVLRAMLWCSVAGAAAAVLALRRQPAAKKEPGLALAFVAQAFTAATHCARIWLVCLLVATAEGDLLLRFLVAAGVLIFAGYDLICFVALLRRAVGVEEEEE